MILYAKNDDKDDYVFILKWSDNSRGFTRKEVLMFDCYEDKWKEYDPKKYYIPANQISDVIDPMDLKMAGSYISHYEDKLNFPNGVKKEFLKLAFEKKVGKTS